MIRIRAYLDGYNLYHAIDRLNDNQLKWVDLWKLSNQFVPSADAQLVGVVYFSAYAKWRPDKMRRHKAYVSALQATGTSVHLSRFKTKDTYCPSCKTKHRGHEEKETDVLIALRLFNDARNNEFDRAPLISRDSDLVPAIKMTKAEFPDKYIHVVAPPNAGHSSEILEHADGKHKIKASHLERCLLPERIDTDDRTILRPSEYDPPT